MPRLLNKNLKIILLILSFFMDYMQKTWCMESVYDPNINNRPIVPWYTETSPDTISMEEWYTENAKSIEEKYPHSQKNLHHYFLWAHYQEKCYAIGITPDEKKLISAVPTKITELTYSLNVTSVVEQLLFSAKQNSKDPLAFTTELLLEIGKPEDPNLDAIDGISALSELHRKEIIEQVISSLYCKNHNGKILHKLCNIPIQSSSSFLRYAVICSLLTTVLIAFMISHKNDITRTIFG